MIYGSAEFLAKPADFQALKHGSTGSRLLRQPELPQLA